MYRSAVHAIQWKCMFQSLRYSQIALRLGLAVVFLWFGIDKFIQPQYWLDAWVPQGIQAFASRSGIGPIDLMHLLGIVEVLVALSLATGFFMRYFAAAAAVLLIGVIAMHGFSELLVRDVGLVGGLVALILWPERTYV